MMKKFTLLALALIASSVATDAATTGFSYAPADGSYVIVGTGKKEVYNCAIALTPAAGGLEITEITVPVAPTAGASGFSIWVSNALTIDKVDGVKQNIPDYSIEATYPESGAEVEWISVTLPEPYTVPEAGCYVGYTFEISELADDVAKYPMVLAKGTTTGGFYFYTSKTYPKWNERNASMGYIAMIQVSLQGDFPENGIALESIPSVYLAANEAANVTVGVYNTGLNAISSIAYTSKVGDASIDREIILNDALSSNMALKYEVEFELPAVAETGEYATEIVVTAVNGVAVNASAQGKATVMSFIPVHYPVLEEYTGTGCGYCPRGFVALEEMNRLYPDFIALAYHAYNSTDPMYPKATGYPKLFSGAPGGYLDRTLDVDPYYGTSNSEFYIPQDYEARRDLFTPVQITLAADYSNGIVTVDSEVNWAAVPDDAETNNYRLEYVLVADGLYGENWAQSNYYYSYSPFYLMEDFCSGGKYGTSSVKGLTFNDVVLLSSGNTGVEGSIPSIALNESTTHQYTFDTSLAVNSSGAVPFDKNKLYVVAMVLNGSNYGKIVNAAKVLCTVDGVNSVNKVESEREIASEVYYDLQGRIVRNPDNGIFIRSIRYTDGSVSNTKVIK